ncbi:exopolyphosphatase/guanosine-5'-triphosphate,3'-diphosphate pyrophosphatase [Novosphingobium hassiacum]|uniref:Exopolyphosphatase/guanosine-5'-triphosphate, 3'-diphosphate pyrophosphatase n=1 Tax=Novosphingobium hassiacum TaxID=173676 RepID=A0A7W6EXT8_9SPHN|nr:exopolyphosphatase/guanosine-5'-triphosphate,3'-diphosphate pyrophosphatase [Novosphingobium hassiacum]
MRSGKKKGKRKSRPHHGKIAGKSPGRISPIAPTPLAGPATLADVGDLSTAPVLPETESEPAAPATSERPAIWQKPLPHHRQAYAAIDLGTNNCRLLIARPSGEHFVVIDAFSRVVRLGEGLAQTGYLSQEAMDRALAALHVCADKLRKRNVHLARSVATEACRRATNGAQFIDRVYDETGIRLNIITAQEEARLAVLGCHILLEQGEGPAMIFDIGGGSTEMVLVETGDTVPRIIDWQSAPWGVVSLTESVGAIDDTPQARAIAYAEMRRRVDEGFADFAERVASMRDAATGAGRIRLLGTSGTVTTLASLHLELPQYDRRAVDGLVVPAESMRAISERLSKMTPAERIALPCIGRERSDLVVAGCAILESILEIWPADRLGIADRGIREGILRSLMAGGASPKSAQQRTAA